MKLGKALVMAAATVCAYTVQWRPACTSVISPWALPATAKRHGRQAGRQVAWARHTCCRTLDPIPNATVSAYSPAPLLPYAPTSTAVMPYLSRKGSWNTSMGWLASISAANSVSRVPAGPDAKQVCR